jgi:hypothetical protein
MRNKIIFQIEKYISQMRLLTNELVEQYIVSCAEIVTGILSSFSSIFFLHFWYW